MVIDEILLFQDWNERTHWFTDWIQHRIYIEVQWSSNVMYYELLRWVIHVHTGSYKTSVPYKCAFVYFSIQTHETYIFGCTDRCIIAGGSLYISDTLPGCLCFIWWAVVCHSPEPSQRSPAFRDVMGKKTTFPHSSLQHEQRGETGAVATRADRKGSSKVNKPDITNPTLNWNYVTRYVDGAEWN